MKFFLQQIENRMNQSSVKALSAFANARKSFQLKDELEPVTAGFTVNRVKSVLKSSTYEVCGLARKKRKTRRPKSARREKSRKKLPTVIVGLFSLREKAPTKKLAKFVFES